MIVPCVQFELELDTAEECGRWVEHEPVEARLEGLGEARSPVAVGLRARDLDSAVQQLDRHSRGRPPGRGIEHVG